MNYNKIEKIVIDALEDIKGENIVTIDTQKTSSAFSKIIICSGNSSRHVMSLANNVISEFKQHNITILGVEGNQNGEWVLVDCGDIIVHVMLPNVRSYYDLETLWNETTAH